MRCVACQVELLPGKQFCHACGTRAPRLCNNCGHPIDDGFRFCPECGAPAAVEASPQVAPTAAVDTTVAARDIPAVLAAKIRATQGVIAGERKLVTVMFCDLVGSTSIAERLDPEEYRDLLDQYMAIAFQEVYRVEGIITHLAGDGVMALFGAPVAHEDAPYRGIYAALAIRDALAQLSARLRQSGGVELRVRIGVHTGPVVVGTVGSDLKMDYTAIGDTTNLSQRLQSVAEPGMVLISEATNRLVRGFFDVLPARRFEVKGKHEPIVAYAVRGLAEATTPMAIAAARGLTPLVGRGEELAQLVACFERLTGSLSQTATVVGDAGSGKSRLVHELKQRLQDVPVEIFEGRCSAMTQGVPYAPWVTMMRQYFGLEAGDGESVAWPKIADRLGARAEDLATAHPGLLYALGVRSARGAGVEELSGDELKRRTFEAVSGIVKRATEKAPVVMIIEDVHWMDDPSREMLAVAVGRTHRSRVMILITHRPDHQPAWRLKGAFTQLTLGPLPDEETIGIVRGVAGGALPPELEERLVRKADGNPFFAEEITRTLVEEGYLLRGDDHVRVTRPVEEIRMPGTVEELVGARLDRLGPQAKRVIQVAAVLGRQFRRGQLIELLAGEEIDVATHLAELIERGVLHRAGPGSDELRFGESLTQEVAYEGLLLRQRRTLHARVGHMLEAVPGEPTPERQAVLAHHFARSDDYDRAVNALLAAARAAEGVPSFRAAAGFYREAFEMAESRLQSQPDDLERQRHSLQAAYGLCRMAIIYGVAGLDEGERAGKRARQLAEQLNDTEAFVDLCTFQGALAMANRVRAKFDAGFAIIEEGLGVAERAGLVVPAARALRSLAMGHLFDGRFEPAEREIDKAIVALASVDGDRPSDIALGALTMRDRLAYYRDDMVTTLERAAATYDTTVRVGNRTIQTAAAATLAQAHFVRGEYEAAQHWVDRSLEVALAIGNIAATRSAGAVGLLVALQVGEAGPATARYLDLLEHGPTVNVEPLSSAFVIEALLAADSLEQAEQLAEAVYLSAGGRLRDAVGALALGEVRRRKGGARQNEAPGYFERARRLADDVGVRSIAANAIVGLGELALERGDVAAAIARFEEATAIHREIGFGHYAARGERMIAACRADAQRSA